MPDKRSPRRIDYAQRHVLWKRCQIELAVPHQKLIVRLYKRCRRGVYFPDLRFIALAASYGYHLRQIVVVACELANRRSRA